MRSEDIGTGVYGGGRYLSVWSMADGYPRCPSPALVLGTAPAAEVAATIAVNRAVAAIAARAEAVEAAARVAAHDPPPATLAAGPDGEPVEGDNPAYAAWVAAGQVLADASSDDDLQHLLRTRAGALRLDAQGVPEPGWTLSLPPVPPLDPHTQTAVWDGAHWHVRALTEAERERHPIPSLRDSLIAALAATDAEFQARWHEDARAGLPPHQSEQDWLDRRQELRRRLADVEG
ncbi:hypothetical protein [Niveispirillum sp.]|uniref:hypothetical protein n=1 Tax=Niveispirillum sp. TaxID=1917217 RepID=UPI001B6B895A|nr:hypothetical protein [Niveispirillum sp.]MBP7340456.1 hypothetical protein [Niveispirillum sp.]